MKSKFEQELIQYAMVVMAGELWQVFWVFNKGLYGNDKYIGTYAFYKLISYQARLLVDEYMQKMGDTKEMDRDKFLDALRIYEKKVFKICTDKSENA